MKTLDEIANFYGTDKGSNVHDYCRKYEKYLPFKKTDRLKILEIGVYDGSSLKMWKEYYNNSEIIGIDVNQDCKKYEEDRIAIHIGSQIDAAFLNNIITTYGNFDFIIDDGSHICSDVIFSFKALFNSVKSGGVYLVEDTCTSYYLSYGGGIRQKGSTIEYFKDIVDEVNFFGEIYEIIDPKTQMITYLPNGKVEGTLNRNDSKLLEQFIRKGHDKRHIGIQIESLNFFNSFILITKR